MVSMIHELAIHGGVAPDPVRTLYRPVGPKELALIAASRSASFLPGLPEQPIFYPVTSEACARHIAVHWNLAQDGSGYVPRFAVCEDFIVAYPVQQVGARIHTEHWISADELPAFNRNIVGLIEVILAFERAWTQSWGRSR